MDSRYLHRIWSQFIFLLCSPKALSTPSVFEVRSSSPPVGVELAKVLKLCKISEQQLPQGAPLSLHCLLQDGHSVVVSSADSARYTCALAMTRFSDEPSPVTTCSWEIRELGKIGTFLRQSRGGFFEISSGTVIGRKAQPRIARDAPLEFNH